MMMMLMMVKVTMVMTRMMMMVTMMKTMVAAEIETHAMMRMSACSNRRASAKLCCPSHLRRRL